jgi:DNA transformation protein and related proteins
MPKAPDPLAEYIIDQLRDWAPVTARRLFGGWGVYRGPLMFGLIARDTLYFRVDAANRPDYEAAATGPRPFTYTMSNGKTAAMAYYEVPPDVLEDVEALPQWAAKAEAAALRAKAGKTRKPTRKRGGK